VVRAYVADRKPKIRVEAGRGPVNVFFPQTHRPGAEAEVDFGEVAINLRGETVTCMLFAFRLSFSGKTVHNLRRVQPADEVPPPAPRRPAEARVREAPVGWFGCALSDGLARFPMAVISGGGAG
jgi:hypothetical protein